MERKIKFKKDIVYVECFNVRLNEWTIISTGEDIYSGLERALTKKTSKSLFDVKRRSKSYDSNAMLTALAIICRFPCRFHVKRKGIYHEVNVEIDYKNQKAIINYIEKDLIHRKQNKQNNKAKKPKIYVNEIRKDLYEVYFA